MVAAAPARSAASSRSKEGLPSPAPGRRRSVVRDPQVTPRPRQRLRAPAVGARGGAGAEVYAEVMAREPEGASREYEWAGWEEEEEEKEEESS